MIDEHLLRKLNQGTCTAEELRQLQQYWQKGNYPELDELLEKQWRKAGLVKDELPADLADHLWGKLQTKLEITEAKPLAPRRLRTYAPWSAAAAAILLLLMLGWWWKAEEEAAPTWVVIENNELSIRELQLADGTQVWLSRGSQLRYLDPFPANERSTQLSGRAFFKVTKDSIRPFRVEANGLRTTVLGTSFNMLAPPHMDTVTVALIEGAVRLEPTAHQDTFVLLKPGDEVVYRQTSREFLRDSFRDDAPYAWKNGVIYFQKANVEEVAKTLQDWYGIPFKVESDKLLGSRLVHRYDTKKLTLDEVLQGISKVMDYRFERQADGSVLIAPD